MENKLKKIFGMMLLLFVAFFSLTACKEKVEIDSLKIKEGTITTVYEQGDDVTFENLEVIIRYSDGTLETVNYPSEGLIVSHLSTSTLGTKELLVTYKEKSIKVDIEVVESIPVYLAINKINEIPSIEMLTSNDEDVIVQARNLYDELNESQKEKVNNYEKLTNAEKKLEEILLQEYKEQKKSELISYKSKEDYTDEEWDEIQEFMNYANIEIDKATSKLLVDYLYDMAIDVLDDLNDYEEKVYITKIEIINEDIKYAADGSKYVVINGEEAEYFAIYQLEWRVYPDNANTKEVQFMYDETKTFVEVTEFGTVIFNRKGSITVYVTAKDGSGVVEAIKIIAN